MMGQIPDRPADLEFAAYGEAKTKGSTRSFVPRRKDGSLVTRPNGQPMVVTKNDAGEPAEAWAGIVASAAANAMQDSGVATIAPKVPVIIEMTFYRPRPASHYGSGRNADILKDSAPAAPSTKPDVDKLTRAILDALKGVAWHDDGQVVGAPAWKEFGTPARVEIRLWELPSTVSAASLQVSRSEVPQSALFAA